MALDDQRISAAAPLRDAGWHSPRQRLGDLAGCSVLDLACHDGMRMALPPCTLCIMPLDTLSLPPAPQPASQAAPDRAAQHGHTTYRRRAGDYDPDRYDVWMAANNLTLAAAWGAI